MMKNAYISEVEKVVKQILPKFVERFNTQHNFELPKFEIDLSGWPNNIWNHMRGEDEAISFNTVFAKVKVDVKDGRLGRLKKLLKLVIEQSLSSIGYNYGEVYIEFDKELIQEETNSTDRLKSIITKLISDKPTHQGSYTMPYSDNDDMVDWYVEYVVKNVELWKPNERELIGCDEDTLYTGTVYINVIRILVGFEVTDEWERGHGEDDLPSWCWDDVKESIMNTIEQMLPQICVDVDLSFKVNYE